MKAQQPQPQSDQTHTDTIQASSEEWDVSDPVWKLLDQANEPEVNAFFARNVVRTARQMEQERPNLAERLTGFFSAPRLTFAALACTVALVAWQVVPSDNNQPTTTLTQHTPVETTTSTDVEASDETTYLADLVMTETLSAAADDPSIFTRDEVVAMLDL